MLSIDLARLNRVRARPRLDGHWTIVRALDPCGGASFHAVELRAAFRGGQQPAGRVRRLDVLEDRQSCVKVSTRSQ